MEQSEFESWLGSLHCDLGTFQSTFPTQVYDRDTNKFNVGGNPVMDCYPIQGRVVANNATETGISSDGIWTSWLDADY